MKYQAALQLAGTAPNLYNMPVLHRQMLDTLGIADAQDIVQTQPEATPTDPVSENMGVLIGKPLKAFIYQDHQAHIQTHISFIQDPKIQGMVGQSPNAQAMQGAIAAHIAEHLAFQYRMEIEKQLGVKLPPPGEPLPEDIEYRISQLVAPAAAQLLQRDQAEAQMQKQMQEAQDPVLQMEMQKLQLRAQEIQNKAQADMAKIQAEMEKTRIKVEADKERQKTQERIEGARLGVQIANANMQAEMQGKEISSRDQLEGAKLGVQISRELLNAERKPPKSR